MSSLDQIDMISIIIASLGHDVGHPAFTNRYLMNSRHPLIFEYNDYSSLENMHCSLTFQIMASYDRDILATLEPADWRAARKLIIDMILSTDMARHFEILGKFRTRALNIGDIDMKKSEDKTMMLSYALKCADLGYMAKEMDLHVRWSNLARDELFKQGDLEKEQGLTVSIYCDRNNTNIPKSNVSLIVNVCLPLFEVWTDYLGSQAVVDNVLDQLRKNLQYWKNCNKDRTKTSMPASNYNLNIIKKEKINRRKSEK